MKSAKWFWFLEENEKIWGNFASLRRKIYEFMIKVDELLTSIQKIDIEVQSLAMCAYKHEIFEEILQRIQKAVDELNLHSYSNLNSWVKTLDEQVSSHIFSHGNRQPC